MNLLPSNTDREHVVYDHDAVREVSRLNGRPMHLEGKYLWREGRFWRARRRWSLWTRVVRYLNQRGYPAFGIPGLSDAVSEHLCPRWIIWIWTVLLLLIQIAVYLRVCRYFALRQT